MVLTKVDSDRDTVHVEFYETKLHKEGVVELKLSDPSDAAKLHEDDTYEVLGVCDCHTGDEVTIIVHHPDKSVDEIQASCA